MTDGLDISWRQIYWKLAGVCLVCAVALTGLGLWVLEPISCGWYIHCFLPGPGLTKPFGDDVLASQLNADAVLWAVLALMLFVWTKRRLMSAFAHVRR